MKFGKEFFKSFGMLTLLAIALAAADAALKHYGMGWLNPFAMAFGFYYARSVYYKNIIKKLTE